MAVVAGKTTTGAERRRGGRRDTGEGRFAPAPGADDRRRRQDPEPGVRRHLDLQDPLPRGPEAARAPAHRRRLSPLQPGRRRAPAGDPADAARRVPAAAGDPPGAGDRGLHRPPPERREPEAAGRLGRRAGHHVLPGGAARPGGRERVVPARAPGVRDRHPDAGTTGDRPTTRPTSRSFAPPPSCRGSASPGATCASSAPRPTARRRCSSSCSAPSFARAARRGARRRSRTSRASPRSAVISSTCCWSATCAASSRPPNSVADAMPRVSRSRTIAAEPDGSGTWSPTRTTCRAGGRGPSASRTCATRRATRALDRRARNRARRPGAGRLPLHRRRPRRCATPGSRRSRGRRSSGSSRRRGSRSGSIPPTDGDRG